jgi:capsule biosynthesis phosphatase
MKRLVLDIDNTMCRTYDGNYHTSEVIEPIRTQLHAYRKIGFEIVLYTSRNVRTFEGNIGKITAQTVPTLVSWLDAHEIPYDEIHVGKPWCGTEGFYVDDKAVRPDEFVDLSYDQIRQLLRDSDERMRSHERAILGKRFP